jgi:hypothetical protein
MKAKKPKAKKSARKCQWMVESKNWRDCGLPAVLIHEGSQLSYCVKHSVMIRAAFGKTKGIA